MCGRRLCADLGGSSEDLVERTEGRRGEGFLLCVDLDEVRRRLRLLWKAGESEADLYFCAARAVGDV